MKALETYPSYTRNNDPDASTEFAHVKGYSRGRSCGTLSKSEWEASCKHRHIKTEHLFLDN